MNSDFLDDASGGGGGSGGSGLGALKRDDILSSVGGSAAIAAAAAAAAGKSLSGPLLQPAPLLASVSDQIRYMSSQLKMTPDQITNVLGLPLTYVQNQVILLNSVNRSSSSSGGNVNKASASSSSSSGVHASNNEGSGDFASPSQVRVDGFTCI